MYSIGANVKHLKNIRCSEVGGGGGGGGGSQAPCDKFGGLKPPCSSVSSFLGL